MIEKINELKTKTSLNEVKSACEKTLETISSAIYNNVPSSAKHEIEKAAINNLFEELSKYKDEEAVNDWLLTQKRLFTIKNLGLREAIETLKESKELKDILAQFKEKLDEGIHETLLYEQFITAMQSFSYFPRVENAIKNISDKVNQYKNDVDITKIIETMKETRSNYLVPLIEDVVNNYLADKNEQTKHLLKETLIKFTYDPFVRDIVNLVAQDATNLQLEYANAECDIEKIFSPVLYVGENEAVFNVKGLYYIKKGNNVNKLHESEIMQLDSEFKALCETLNQENVVFENKGITVYFRNDKAEIKEDKVIINDQEMNEEQFANSAEVSELVGNKDFFMLVEFINNNFAEIAEIDFVKSVYLKEDQGHSAEVFKLRDNVFITTRDINEGKATFYRNINPIQAKNIMMEHLRYDVSSIFSNLLPDEEKIYAQINETKEAYSTYINDLSEKISQFKSKEYGENVNEQVISALEEELLEVKNEFKDYLNFVEKSLRAPEELNEEITLHLDVDGDKYEIPIPDKKSVEKEGEKQLGTEVGGSVEGDKPASAITFDDDETEMLGDEPTIPEDDIDLGVEDIEDEAEEAEKEAEEEEDLSDLEGEEGIGDEEKPSEEDEIKIEDETDIEDEDENNDKKNESLEKTSFVKEGEEGEGDALDEAGDEKPRKRKKVYLKKKSITESVKKKSTKQIDEAGPIKKFLIKKAIEKGVEKIGDIVKDMSNDEEELEEGCNKPKKKVNESSTWNGGIQGIETQTAQAQIGDTVMFDKKKGYVIGQIGEDLIIQVQGSTHTAKPKEAQVLGAKVETIKPPFKFSKETQKLLFEQFVKCGIFMGTTPIKLNDCYVKFSDWQDAKNDDSINIVVEGQNNIMPKQQVRILEDINDFANLDNYIPGVEISDITGDAEGNVMINVVDYTNAIGDADPVRIIRGGDGEEPVTDAVPKSNLRTLSV